jgi:transcriptional regulator of heat shock response
MLGLAFYSCKGSADSKVPELANEMCNCFDSFEKSLSEDAKILLKDVGKAEKPQEVMMAGMQKLKPEDATAFATQLQDLIKSSSPVSKCMQDFDKKHGKETTTDKKELTLKILKEMQKNNGCYVGAAIVNMNPR